MLFKNNKKGYVSIETILVAGLLLVLAVTTMSRYKNSSGCLVDTAIGEMNRVDNSYDNSEN